MKYTEVTHGKTRFKVQEFQGISEFVQYIHTQPINNVFTNANLSSENPGSDFSKTSNYKEAEELLANGWTVQAEKFSKRLPLHTVSSPVANSRPAYSVVGHQASVPRYIQGIPTNMVTRKPDIKKQKIVHLYRDICFSGGTKASQIEEEGIKALQLIQTLEGRGYRVKLSLVFLSMEGSEAVGAVIPVKKPDERLSVSKIAFPIAHPSMLRRILFRWLERFEHLTNGGFTYGYGMPSGSLYKQYFLKPGEIMLPNFIPDNYVDTLGLK